MGGGISITVSASLAVSPLEGSAGSGWVSMDCGILTTEGGGGTTWRQENNPGAKRAAKSSNRLRPKKIRLMEDKTFMGYGFWYFSFKFSKKNGYNVKKKFFGFQMYIKGGKW